MDKEMRRSGIIKLVVWSVVALVLIGVLIGWSQSILQGGPSYGVFSLFGGDLYEDAESYNVGSIEYDEIIDNVDISWSKGSVNIVVWNEKNVKLVETGAMKNDNERMRSKVEDGTLTVKFMESGMHFFQSTPTKSLTVYVPARMAESMRLLTLDCISADISVDGAYQADKYSADVNMFNFESVKVDSISGDVYIDCNSVNAADITNISGAVKLNGKIERLELEGNSGRVEIKGSIGEAKIATVSGAVIVSAIHDLPSSLRIESVSGNVKLELPDRDSGFFAHIDSVSGRLIWNGGSGREYSYGSGKVGYYFATVSGNVEITVKE